MNSKLVLILMLMINLGGIPARAEEEAAAQVPTTGKLAQIEVQRLYLSIKDESKVLDEMIHRRFQRMLLKEIITMGKYELQIMNQSELKTLDFSGNVFKLDFNTGKTPDEVEIEVTLAEYREGKKKNFAGDTVRVSKAGLLSSGIEQVYKILLKHSK